MFGLKLKLGFVSLMTLSVSSIACGGAGSPEGVTQESVDEADFTKTFSAQGLSLDVSTNEHASGSFERDSVVVRFDFSHDDVKSVAKITTVVGEPLIESTLERDLETTVLLGGRAKIVAPVGAEPIERTGEEVSAELAARPEAQVIPLLKEALIAAGVDRHVFLSEPKTSKTTLGAKGFWGNGYYWMPYGDSYVFWSNGWFSPTTVVLANPSNGWGYYRASFQAGLAGPETVQGSGMGEYRRSWGGMKVTVKNTYFQLCDANVPWNCPVSLIARHY